MIFRRNPFQGGFSVACGLGQTIESLRKSCFTERDTAFLAESKGNDRRALFEPAFLDHLRRLKFSCDVDAIPESTVVFPQEPPVRVQGPILQCQLLESALLNNLNFQTLIATKAARICLAARSDPVIEFGLRRAQSANGAMTANRAA